MCRFLSPRWLLAHLLAVVLVAAMLGLAWWQLGRAQDGNTLSIGYSLEWPVFAGFVVFLWFRAVRSAGNPSAESPAVAATSTSDSALPPDNIAQRLAEQRAAARLAARDVDPETAAYNHYLAWLNTNPHRRPNEYPGMEQQL